MELGVGLGFADLRLKAENWIQFRGFEAWIRLFELCMFERILGLEVLSPGGSELNQSLDWAPFLMRVDTLI